MSLGVDSYCIQCYLRRNVELVRPLGPESKTTAFAKEIMKMYLSAPEGVSAPWFGPGVADLLHEMYGVPIDRFHDEKEASNKFILERMDAIRARIREADDPFLAGLQFAILGNYLDFSALQGKVSFAFLDELLEKAREMQLDPENLRSFREELQRGGRLVYLTDNAGEIGFDRLFAEVIHEMYPRIEITFCVRGDIAANDATRADAAAVGIPFPVIDNGNRVAGTQLDQLSEEAAHALGTADILFAKGMANAETMLGCGWNVYYAFLIKCPRFERMFQKPMLTPMLLRERDAHSFAGKL